MPIFGQELTDSEVVGSDGTQIGTYEDLEFDEQTGAVNCLLASPGPETPISRVTFERTDSGRFRIPVDNVKAAKDRILVELTR